MWFRCSCIISLNDSVYGHVHTFMALLEKCKLGMGNCTLWYIERGSVIITVNKQHEPYFNLNSNVYKCNVARYF